MLALLRHPTTVTLVVAAIIFAIATALGPRGAAAGGGGCHGGRPMTDAATTTVALSENCMSPTIARVEPGDAVRFVNKDMAPHTVTGANMLWGNGAEMFEGDEITHTFTQDGVFPYYCLLHPGMAGAIVVGDGRGAASIGEGEVVVPGRLLIGDGHTPAGRAPAAGDAAPAADVSRGGAEGVAWSAVGIASAAGLATLAALAVVAFSRRRPRVLQR